MKIRTRDCAAWLAGLRDQWTRRHPACAERDCNRMRRMSRPVAWWKGKIRLRGASYCAPKCFENAARECFDAACTPVVAASPIQHRIPLGLLMLSRGELTGEQLRAALEAQQGNHHRIGECL